MFRHILVPTDGSPLAAKGVNAALRLAKALRAKVTGLHVAFAYLPPSSMPPISRRQLKEITAAQARKALGPLLAQAAKAGVACTTRTIVAGEPWQAILGAARADGCDLIVMGSHGRSGIAGLILGSETTRVLAASRIPVLVVR